MRDTQDNDISQVAANSPSVGPWDPAQTVVIGEEPSPTDLPADPISPTVGRYVVLEQIGQGGMGRVLRAYDPKLQREVALKEVHRHVLGQEGAARLVAEARAMARLSHPNVVAVYDVQELGDDRLVLVMEYVAGATLQEWLQAQSRSPEEILAKFIAAGRGLAAAHGADLLHRDFKPANVLIGDNSVKVTDFGLAKSPTGGPLSGESLASMTGMPEELTVPGVVMGTPRYMAPEQHRGETLTPSVDQYAFCVALWEALCKTPPFTGKQMSDLKAKGPPAWPHSGVRRKIADAVVRGLAPQPEQRWASMDALLAVLAEDPHRRRNRALWAVASVAMIGATGASVRSWQVARAARCSGAEARLAGVWGDPQRQQVEAAVTGAGANEGAKAWEYGAGTLDRYAEHWVEGHRGACEATRVRGEQSQDVMDLRTACLERAKLELQATVEVLAAADTDVVQHIHSLVDGLPALDRCGDVERLKEDVAPPEPAQAEAVAQARVELAHAAAETRAGRFDRGRQRVEAAKQILDAIDYGPVKSELALADADATLGLGKVADAEQTLRDALSQASGWRQWDLMGEASTRLMAVIGTQPDRADEGLRYRELAEGLAEGDPAKESVVYQIEGDVLRKQGSDLDGAVAQYRLALERAERAYGADHPRTASVRRGLGDALAAKGQHAEALEALAAAAKVHEDILGPEHPELAQTVLDWAKALVVAHDKGAVAMAERARSFAGSPGVSSGFAAEADWVLAQAVAASDASEAGQARARELAEAAVVAPGADPVLATAIRGWLDGKPAPEAEAPAGEPQVVAQPGSAAQR